MGARGLRIDQLDAAILVANLFSTELILLPVLPEAMAQAPAPE